MLKNIWKNKALIPIILIFFLLATTSGCVNFAQQLSGSPVITLFPPNVESSRVELRAGFARGFAKNQDPFFVYDTVKHESWEDYAHRVPATFYSSVLKGPFHVFIDTDDLEPSVWYHYRAVAYCYDFISVPPYEDCEDGWYSGWDMVFKSP